VTTIITRGKVHGDLHPGNLLLGRKEDDFSYCLIDLSRYSASCPLAWDPIYLTLTTVAKFLHVVDFRYHEALQLWVLDPGSQPGLELPPVLRATVIGVHGAAAGWARSRGGAEPWESQRLLCITAIALVLTGRDRLLSAEAREWFFWLAARAATRLIPSTPDFAPENQLGLAGPLIVADNVINLDERRRATGDVPETAAESPVSDQAELWTELIAQLRVVRLDASDPAIMVVRTEALRALLVRAKTNTSGPADDVSEYVDDLTSTLDEAVRPGAPSHEVRLAGAQAEQLRTWLLDRLS